MSTSHTPRAAAVLAAAAACAAGLLAPGQAQAAPAATHCPKATGTQFAFSTALTNGELKVGANATSTGGSATGCGLLTLDKAGKIQGTILPKNITFAPTTTKVGLLSLPTTIRATSALTGPVAFTKSGGQRAALGGSVVATADILGSKCDIPIKVTLTTGKSGALTGRQFRFDGDRLRGKLVANNFAVPAISPTATCNLLVAASSNLLLGLPLAPGASSITYDAALVLS